MPNFFFDFPCLAGCSQTAPHPSKQEVLPTAPESFDAIADRLAHSFETINADPHSVDASIEGVSVGNSLNESISSLEESGKNPVGFDSTLQQLAIGTLDTEGDPAINPAEPPVLSVVGQPFVPQTQNAQYFQAQPSLATDEPSSLHDPSSFSDQPKQEDLDQALPSAILLQLSTPTVVSGSGYSAPQETTANNNDLVALQSLNATSADDVHFAIPVPTDGPIDAIAELAAERPNGTDTEFDALASTTRDTISVDDVLNSFQLDPVSAQANLATLDDTPRLDADSASQRSDSQTLQVEVPSLTSDEIIVDLNTAAEGADSTLAPVLVGSNPYGSAESNAPITSDPAAPPVDAHGSTQPVASQPSEPPTVADSASAAVGPATVSSPNGTPGFPETPPQAVSNDDASDSIIEPAADSIASTLTSTAFEPGSEDSAISSTAPQSTTGPAPHADNQASQQTEANATALDGESVDENSQADLVENQFADADPFEGVDNGAKSQLTGDDATASSQPLMAEQVANANKARRENDSSEFAETEQTIQKATESGSSAVEIDPELQASGFEFAGPDQETTPPSNPTLDSSSSALPADVPVEFLIDPSAASNITAFETTAVNDEITETLSLEEFIQDPSSPAAVRKTGEVLRDAFESSMRLEGKTVQVELHPADLGTLKIQVTQHEHSIEATIVATEYVTSELLLSQRDQLMNTLADLGFDNADVDISHGEHSQSEPEQQQRSPEFTYKSKSELPAMPNQSSATGGINIVA